MIGIDGKSACEAVDADRPKIGEMEEEKHGKGLFQT